METHCTNPMIHRAYDALKKLSADEETRQLAEMREKALKDEVSALDAARREGEKRGEKKVKKSPEKNCTESALNGSSHC